MNYKGKALEFIDDRPGASHMDISFLEERIQTRLPNDYLDFVLLRDGGLLDSKNCEISIGQKGFLLIDEIYGVRDGAEYEDVGSVIKSLEGTLPVGHIPVAGDRFGNEICINLRSGSVVLLDHELGNLNEHLTVIGSSFSSFLFGLTKEAN